MDRRIFDIEDIEDEEKRGSFDRVSPETPKFLVQNRVLNN